MSTQLARTEKPSALAVMAGKINVDPAKLHATLKATVFKGASDEELLALVVVANTYGLNPLLKELYAFPAKGGGIVPVVSIDGWVSMVNGHPAMDGMQFEEHSEDGKLVAITCRIWRKDRSRPIEVTEHLSECKRNTEPWKMEHRMLRHKALMQCARYAFGFSGIVDEDEAAEVTMKKATGKVIEKQFQEFAEPAKIEATEEPQTEELL
jgi:phage recombination protein Bet